MVKLSVECDGIKGDNSMLEPISVSGQKIVDGIFKVRGSVSVNASIEKQIYSPGDSIQVICSISNQIQLNIRPRTTLVQTQTFCAQPSGRTRKIINKIYRVYGNEIVAKSDGDEQLTIIIPQSISHTIHCQIILVT